MLDRRQEIMDLIFAIAFGIVFILYLPSGINAVVFTVVFIICGFTPFGWRCTGNLAAATGLRGLARRLLVSILISVIAGPVTLGRDIVSIVSYIKCK